MRSMFALYWRSHRLIAVVAVALGCVVAVVAIGRVAISLPWISREGLVNVAVVAEIAYGCLIPLTFRNRASELEEIGERNWKVPDSLLVGVLWGLPVAVVVLTEEGLRFFYACSLLQAAWIVLGRWLRSDTVMVAIVGAFLVQTALWSAVAHSPWRFALFLLETPPAPVACGLAGLGGVVCLVGVGAYKAANPGDQAK
ncbi:hypothetical protein ACEE23_00520 [Corynebacterium sp. 32222D000AT]|nr:hypothetical protein [Mycobacteriaceae bacterium]MDY5829484.1 hypothetical protein [Corynebacterium sp.]